MVSKEALQAARAAYDIEAACINEMKAYIDDEQFAKRMLTYASKISDISSTYGGPIGARVPDDITLREYQKDAISVWVGENYRGIYDMATGTGKTLTGLGAISKLSEDYI